MKRKRRTPAQQAGAPKWMVTFSDLVTLILVFFILMFSMSQIDNEKFQTITKSFRESKSLEQNNSIVPGEYPSEELQTGGQASLDHVYEEVKGFLKENGLDEMADVVQDERGVVLVLDEQLLFDSGEAALRPEADVFMKGTGELLAKLPNMIKVEGHTDSIPIQSIVYPSNWELSSARASSVIRYFTIEFELAPERFTAVGYADTRPLAPNNSEANRRKNRRVEIIITDPAFINETAQPA